MLTQVSTWVMTEQRFSQESRGRFLAGADAKLVAHALKKGYVLVTLEKPASTGSKVKIPDACKALGVEYLDTFQVLDQLSARFVLEDIR